MARLSRLPWQHKDWDALQALADRHVHALLLHGSPGIGKKVLALDYARARLCEARAADGHACGRCAACHWFDAGHHPDLRLVVPDSLASWRLAGGASEEEAEATEAPSEAAPEADHGKAGKSSREILIGAVRKLAEFLGTSTHRGGVRVVLLAPAERLNTAAANALLKMLEEPPPATLFILCADTLDDVMPTIRSRCLLHRCHAPEPAQALAWLREQQLPDPERLLAEAGGAPLVAWAAVKEEAGAGTLDADLRQHLLQMLAQGSHLAPAEITQRVPKTVPVEASITLFQRWGWDLLALRNGGAVRYHPRQAQALQRLSRTAPAAAVIDWLERLARLRATRDHPLNARLVVESALISYIHCLGGPSAGQSA